MKNKICKIGVTGHRDLRQGCITYYENKVYRLLKSLQEKYDELLIYTPLADGADRLIAKEALKLNISYEAVFPMSKEIYIMDFNTESKIEFDYLLSNAKNITILPICNEYTIKATSLYGKERDAQYEAVGKKIADLSDMLIALWDGKKIGLAGGTGEIVDYYSKKKNNILYHLQVSRSKDITKAMVDFKLYKGNTGETVQK